MTIAMTALMLGGCGNATVQSEEVSLNVESSKATEETTTATTEAVEENVVASSVAVVQILDALGVPMVGVPTSSYELPQSVADATRIGNPMSPDLEVIASLEPDVIVSVDSLSQDLQSQFETIGAESYFVGLSGYEDLKESILLLGERFEVEEKAKELVNGFEEKEAAISESIADKESPSVLIIFGAGESFMVCSEDSYVGDLAKRVGATNVIQNAPAAFSPVDMEYLASQNPDYILFMAHANPEESLAVFQTEFEKNEAWQNLRQ